MWHLQHLLSSKMEGGHYVGNIDKKLNGLLIFCVRLLMWIKIENKIKILKLFKITPTKQK